MLMFVCLKTSARQQRQPGLVVSQRSRIHEIDKARRFRPAGAAPILEDLLTDGAYFSNFDTKGFPETA